MSNLQAKNVVWSDADDGVKCTVELPSGSTVVILTRETFETGQHFLPDGRGTFEEQCVRVVQNSGLIARAAHWRVEACDDSGPVVFGTLLWDAYMREHFAHKRT